MKYPFLIACALIFVSACGEKKPSVPALATAAKDSVLPPTPYFPVVNFLKGEIAYVDSLPIGIKKYCGDNKKKYSYIKSAEFHRLAADFIPPEIEGGAFQKNYQETSFLDRSNSSGTFMYMANNASLPVQRIDVLTAKGDVYDQIKSIYLQKNYRSGDTAFTKKLYWKPKQRFQVITEKIIGSGQPLVEVVNVVWDTKEEE